MRRLIYILLSIMITAALSSFAGSDANVANEKHQRLAPESLDYRVMFKWGLINKQAGTARLELKHGDDTYMAHLSASSDPWADKIFRVRDTLIGRMSYKDFTPLYYEKIAHEGNDDKHDIVKYDYSRYPACTSADCWRKVYRKGVLKVDETKSMESQGLALDMLTSFYFMRSLPFADWKPGHIEVADIFSGKQKEVLSIVYQGLENVEIEGIKYPCYHITFKFTSGGGKKTSDDMDAWIAADKSRIPLKLEGKLPIGKVHCLYIPSK